MRGETVYQAARCCLKLLTDLGEFKIDIKNCDTKALKIHLGIGAGKVYDILVGGYQDRWEHFLAGEAANQLSQVLDLAKAGLNSLTKRGIGSFTSSASIFGICHRYSHAKPRQL